MRLEKAAKKSLAADTRLYPFCAPLKYLIIWISDVLKVQKYFHLLTTENLITHR